MRSTPTLAALCAIAVLGLTACGGEDKGDGADKAGAKASAKGTALTELTGPQIANKALKATKGVSALTFTLDGTEDGAPVKYRVSSDSSGDCVADLGIDGGTVKLIKKGDTAYMKYDAAFWKAQGKDGEDAAKVIGDRWTKTKASGSDAKALTEACDSDQLLAEAATGPNAARKGRTTTVDGRPAIILTEQDGDATYTMYVATEGKPYFLKVEQKGGKDPGTITFSDFDKPVGAVAPKGDVVDLDQP
ncbi:hypothetical protein ACZ90_33970 [Streptomyces albus subsp. albus]|nr:hypothetical protein ACZ90_33970 [Streptomyces albus subsp. albus]